MESADNMGRKPCVCKNMDQNEITFKNACNIPSVAKWMCFFFRRRTDSTMHNLMMLPFEFFATGFIQLRLLYIFRWRMSVNFTLAGKVKLFLTLSLSRHLLCVCHLFFRRKTTMSVWWSVCTLYRLPDERLYNTRQIQCAYSFWAQAHGRTHLTRIFMTNNENSSDNNM